MRSWQSAVCVCPNEIYNHVMLSGEGNENGKKTTISPISKKTTLHVQHTFLYISLPLFCTTTAWNFLVTRFMEEMSYLLMFTFFSLPLQNLHVVLPTNGSLISPALALCRCFFRWASLACRPLSLFLCLSLSTYSKFVDMTIDLSLIL